MTHLFVAKPFLIAECGSNWRTLDDCLKSIEIARRCRANAVKFQAFNCDALFGMPFNYIDQELGHGEPAACSVYNSTLPLEWLPALKAKADACGIELMVTAFSPELVAAVDPFVEVHKVASSDAAWPQMLDAVARCDKPVVISFGGKTEDERYRAISYLSGALSHGREHVVSMYCVAAYPADHVDLYAIRDYDGFSDHSLGYTAAVHAAKECADVIEKHFTAFPDMDTPDRPHSLTPAQFERMVSLIRGDGVESEETAMTLRANRRLIATREIIEGDTFQYDVNYGAYRALKDDKHGLAPFRWQEVEGKTARKTIRRGEPIGEGDFT